MKLFDLSPADKSSLRVFVIWHVGYVVYVALFSTLIYRLHLFKAYWFLKEFWILNLLAPMHTLTFIVIGPYRRNWIRAVTNMYRTLEGEPVFCFMAYLVLALGFYLYTVFIWSLGSFFPSMFFN
ncbi:MAG: hypothetical protein V1742_02985 [Pseudomonadota bacterium]